MNKNIIKFETTRKDLTYLTGLFFYQKIINQIGLRGVIGKMLPSNDNNYGLRNADKFLTGIYALIAGSECLDDLQTLRRDTLFQSLTTACSSVTMGRFLRSFNLKTLQKIQNYLPEMALRLRNYLYPENDVLILSQDATPHQQYGEYMEGVEYNYKQFKSLDSQNMFDQYGFCFGWDLRPGNTHSRVGAEEMINRVVLNLPKNHNKRIYYRADSAYGAKDIYNCLLTNNIKFTICLRQQSWQSLLDKYGSRLKWKKSSLHFFGSSKCEVTTCLYPLKDLVNRGFLRVVFIRTRNKKKKLPTDSDYRHYAIVTDIESSELNDEQIINFYRMRANVENQIKDLKNGMDFKHFPSQKMNANKAWGLMGILAYNLMRYSTFKIFKKSYFINTIRRKVVYIASEIRKGQRKIKLRVTKTFFKEVNYLNIMTTLDLSRSQLAGCDPPVVHKRSLTI